MMTVGKKYKYNGGSYVYRGKIDNIFEAKKSGLYSIKGKYRVVKVKREEEAQSQLKQDTHEEAVQDQSNMLLKDILINRNVDGIIRANKMTNPVNIAEDEDAEVLEEGKRVSLDSVLRYNISPKDDQMVQLVKEQVNMRNIRGNSISYNLVYGLRVHNTMKYDTFARWAKILGMEIKISLV